MTYDQLIMDTDKMIRRVMLQNDIAIWTLSAMLMMLILMVAWIEWTEHREKMRRIRDQQEWEDVRGTYEDQRFYRM